MLTRDSTELTDPRVVPSLADRWSHHTGGTHFKVVPSHWRATPGTAPRGRADRRTASVMGHLGENAERRGLCALLTGPSTICVGLGERSGASV